MHKWYQSAAGGPMDPCWDCGAAYDVANFSTPCHGPPAQLTTTTTTTTTAAAGHDFDMARVGGPCIYCGVGYLAWSGAMVLTNCPRGAPSAPAAMYSVNLMPLPSYDPSFEIMGEPAPTPKSTWPHGTCLKCNREICPPLDGDGAELCRQCSKGNGGQWV